jgi:hypothetical protein
MVDKALLLRKLAELEEYLGQIREYSNIIVKEYSEDWKTQRIVERTLTPNVAKVEDAAEVPKPGPDSLQQNIQMISILVDFCRGRNQDSIKFLKI